MLSKSFLAAMLAFIPLALTNPQYPTPTYVTPPPPGDAYVTGYPICGVPGYTVVPGNYTETIEQQYGSMLLSCVDQCRKTQPACLSVAYSANYTECLFFNAIVEDTQFTNANTSGFVHYDLSCYVK